MTTLVATPGGPASGGSRWTGKLFVQNDLMTRRGGHIIMREPQIMEHFQGSQSVAATGIFKTTETGAATPFAASTSVEGGAAVAVTGATTNNAEEMGGFNVGWVPSSQANSRLVFECRASFVGATTPTDGDFYLGLANANTYASGLSYVITATSTFTTKAPVEFAGFGYTSIATSGVFFLSGGNPIVALSEKSSGTPATTASTMVKDSLMHTYRVEVDAAGNAFYFIDDAGVGVQAAAVTAATALTPYVGAICKASHALTASVDYIYVGGNLK
jgi:hypothetical protein